VLVGDALDPYSIALDVFSGRRFRAARPLFGAIPKERAKAS